VYELSNIRNIIYSESTVSQLSNLRFAKMQYFIHVQYFQFHYKIASML